MLVNVKFFRKIFLVFILLPVNLSASEKDQIINQLNNLNSLEFTFNQTVNNKTENGSCLLEFPGKLKCNYFDDKEIGDVKNQGDKDELYQSALEIIRSEGKASTSFLQRKLQIGYNSCLLYTSPSPRDGLLSRMPSSA